MRKTIFFIMGLSIPHIVYAVYPYILNPYTNTYDYVGLEGVIDVKDYGAKGDGSTDDTNAFVKAVATSFQVFIPSGTYIVGEFGPTNRSNFTMFGVGNSSILKMKTNNNAPLLAVTNCTGCTFRDFKIDGNASNQSVNNVSYGVDVVASSQTTIQNLTIRNTNGHAIAIESDSIGDTANDRIMFNDIDNIGGTTSQGIATGIGAGVPHIRMHIIGNTIRGTPFEGAQLYLSSSEVNSNHFQTPLSIGVTLTNGGGNELTGNEFIGNVFGLELGQNTNDTVISGNYIESTGSPNTHALSFAFGTGYNRISITGNTIRGQNILVQAPNVSASSGNAVMSGNLFYKTNPADQSLWITPLQNVTLIGNMFDTTVSTMSQIILQQPCGTLVVGNYFVGSSSVANTAIKGTSPCNSVYVGNLKTGAWAPDVTEAGDFDIDGSSVPTAGAALCLTAAGLMGHCSTTPTGGNCTCVNP